MASSSSSFPSSSPTFQVTKTYDVFISFRGSDVRDDFLSHLHEALCCNEIDAFLDENLKRGEGISKSLLDTIEDSYTSIIIFSENYVYSEWCLEELVKIVKCKNTMGMTVIPVFYGVDPSHVQELTGSYGDAIARHRQAFDESLVELWGQCLKDVASLPGLVSQNIKPESNLITEIVKHTWEKLKMIGPDVFNYEGLVGLDSRIESVQSLLCPDSPNVRVIGIWGMPGIGKSTIAKKVYELIEHQFTGQCYIANVRERLEKTVASSLQTEILSAILGPQISNMGKSLRLSPNIAKTLARRKVLIVLDDVNDLGQVEQLIGSFDIYGPGSRIIITSRDKHILKNVFAKIYEVKPLDKNEALWLFCKHAFKRNIPNPGFKKLTGRALEYSEGNPLALKVLGAALFSRSVDEWEVALENLKGTSQEKIGRILRISYNRLRENDKEIFLYIACFFNREDKDRVLSILDAAGSLIGISRLVEKCLISVEEKKLEMHDLIQQMGKDVTREEKQLGKRRILWHHNDVCLLLTKDEGTEANKGLSLDMSKIEEVELSPTVFERMYNLRLLKFYNSIWKPDNKIKVYLPKGLSYLPNELRFLQWDQYPLTSLPSSSFAENLIELRLPDSKLTELWNGAQQLEKLKLIDVSGSSELVKLPDLSRSPKVKVLELISCRSLVEIPSTLQHLTNLVRIDLSGCDNLLSLPSLKELKNLESLNLFCCSKITKLPELPPSVKELGIRGSAMTTLPSSIGCLSQLQTLDLGSFQDSTYMPSNRRYHDYFGDLPVSFFDSGMGLEELPESLGDLKSLKDFIINKCLNLQTLPENLGNLESLENLRIVCSGVKKLPESIGNLKCLKDVYINDCESLSSIPESFGDLESLETLQVIATGVKKVPSSINRLRKLKTLAFSRYECLEFPRFTGGFSCLETVFLEYSGLEEFPESFCSLRSLEKMFIGGNEFEYIPESIKQMSKLEELDLRDCKRLKCLPELPVLRILCVSNCKSLKSAFSSFQKQQNPQKLVKLGFGNCSGIDQEEYEKIIDYEFSITPNDVSQVECGPNTWFPGKEVPRNMMYQNRSTYSLTCSFSPKDCLCLYLGAVFDPKRYPNNRVGSIEIGCTAYFIDESGKRHDAISYYYLQENSFHDELCDIVVEMEHFFLWNGSLSFTGNQDDDDEHQQDVVFEFFAEEHNGLRVHDAIVACGVHPLFKDGQPNHMLQ